MVFVNIVERIKVQKEGFPTACLLRNSRELKFRIIVDVSCMEIFADDGYSVASLNFYPSDIHYSIKCLQ